MRPSQPRSGSQECPVIPWATTLRGAPLLRGLSFGLSKTDRSQHFDSVSINTRLALRFCSLLWLQGYTTDAVKTANLAVERALALDHASTLCCALAEGLCMVSALNQDLDGLEKATRDLTCTACRHGLQVWKAYGEIFELWAMMQRKEKPASGRITSVIRLLDEMQFYLWYTPFVADVLRSWASPVSELVPSVCGLRGQPLGDA